MLTYSTDRNFRSLINLIALLAIFDKSVQPADVTEDVFTLIPYLDHAITFSLTCHGDTPAEFLLMHISYLQ